MRFLAFALSGIAFTDTYSPYFVTVYIFHVRINKKGSQKDAEQKKKGNYFFYDDGADEEDDDDIDDSDL